MGMKVAERRRLLVGAAFEVIARDGVAAASTRAICTQAGMPQGAFHYAFPSKDALFEELARTVVSGQTAQLLDLDDAPDTLREYVELAIARVFDTAVADPDRQAVLTELMVFDLRSGEDPGELNRRQFRLYSDIALELLDNAGRRYHTTWTVPVDALARMVAITMSGTAIAWLGDRDTDLARRSLRVLAEAITELTQ